MWAGLNGFDPRIGFVLGGVRIGMDCMNLVTVISSYRQVPITLAPVGLAKLMIISLSYGVVAKFEPPDDFLSQLESQVYGHKSMPQTFSLCRY